MTYRHDQAVFPDINGNPTPLDGDPDQAAASDLDGAEPEAVHQLARPAICDQLVYGQAEQLFQIALVEWR